MKSDTEAAITAFGKSEQVKKVFRALFVALLCPVGYAADKPMQKVRFAKEDIMF